MHFKIYHISEINVIISDLIWTSPLSSTHCENEHSNCERVVNEEYLPSWADFSEYDMLINSGRVLWIVFASL